MRITVLDLETDPFRVVRKPEPFVSGYFDGDKFTSIWDDEPIRVIDRTVTMLEHEKPSICYWHNGGKFDVFCFMRYVKGNVKIISNRIVSCVIAGHEFRDSYAIMPFPLRAYKKDEIDYEIMERGKRDKHREEIVSYLRGDCEYLHELVTTFHSEFGNRLTIGGSSMRQLKTFHSFATGDVSYDSSLRTKFYFGGRNQCFATGLVYAPLKVYDVNSMYPHVMRSMLHPVSVDSLISNTITDQTCFVTVKGINRGAFPLRTKTGLDFTCSEGVFHTSIHEYRAAIDNGSFEGEVIETYDWSETSTFAGFVDHFFAKRKEAKLAGDIARGLLYKFTHNSAYGKFAQNPENFYDYQITSSDVSLNEPCEHCHGFKLCRSVRPSCPMCKRLNGDVIPDYCMFCDGSGRKWSFSEGTDSYIIWQARPRASYFHNVATGASITAAARSVLLRGLALVEHPVYCDTDSIIGYGDCSLPLSDIDIGSWKIEAEGDCIAICGKKLYCLYSYADNGGESVTLPNKRRAWVVKKAHKGVRLTGAELLRIALGETVEYASPVPTLKRDGRVIFQERKIRMTV
jgi:hypothetical protein